MSLNEIRVKADPKKSPKDGMKLRRYVESTEYRKLLKAWDREINTLLTAKNLKEGP